MIPNYAEIWRDSFKDGNGSMELYQEEETAKSYDASATIWQDGYARTEDLPCAPGDRVLDIGCGPGVLSVPLAERGCDVTVVEPSTAMLRLLSEHCCEKGLHISQIHSTWEDAVLPDDISYDYVIASYSLGMSDIEAALKKMNDVAGKRVFLYWFCGITGWERITADLLPKLGRGEQPYRPKTDILYGVLAQMGIAADVQWLEGTKFDRTFPDRQGALEDLRKRFGVTDVRHDDLFEDYLDHGGVYRATADGWLYMDSTRYVCISWKPTGRA